MLGFGAGILYGIQTSDASGTAVANATPVQFATLQDVSADISFEEKLLYGAYQLPIAVGRGKGKLGFSAKIASFSGQILGDLFFGSGSTAGIKGVVNNFAAAIPTTPFTVTVTPPSSGTFSSDLGVINASTGVPLKRVASGPTTGQYSQAGAVYTFAAADTGIGVLISYEYTATSTSGPKNSAFTNQLMGYAPAFRSVLTMSFQGKQFTLALNNCVATKFNMPFKNDDFVIPQFEYSAFADAAGNIGYWASGD